jgi:multiple sugar transport system permease protein
MIWRRRAGRSTLPSLGGLLAVPILVLAGLFLLPLYWMLVGSFEGLTDTLKIPPDWFPTSATLTNYSQLLTRTGAPRWLLNSCIVAGVSSLGAVMTSATAGYVLGTKVFPGVRLVFWTVMAALALPGAVTVVPLYLTMRDLGWVNTYQAMIAPEVAYPFGVFLVRQFVRTVPRELFDAAKVDGAGEGRTFTMIVVPLIKPALGAVAVFSFIAAWNNFLWQSVIISSRSLTTLPVGVSEVAVGFDTVNIGLSMAGGTMAFVPMLVVFLAFQRYFVRGLTLGSVKG